MCAPSSRPGREGRCCLDASWRTRPAAPLPLADVAQATRPMQAAGNSSHLPPQSTPSACSSFLSSSPVHPQFWCTPAALQPALQPALKPGISSPLPILNSWCAPAALQPRARRACRQAGGGCAGGARGRLGGPGPADAGGSKGAACEGHHHTCVIVCLHEGDCTAQARRSRWRRPDRCACNLSA